MTSDAPPVAARAAHEAEFREELFATGWLVATGVDGLYLRSGPFEAVVEGVNRLVTRAAASDGVAATYHLPPLMSRKLLEQTDYVRSFPDLVGVVSSFNGGDAEHAALLGELDGEGDWSGHLEQTELALCSAACHPLYPTLQSPLPAAGTRYEVFGQCFRHEPSIDPARMQVFRQHEVVYVGSEEGAREHRDRWVERALELLGGLGLDVTPEVANDPFFGRNGRLLAASQRAEALKIEVVTPICTDSPTAIASSNCHHDHFGTAFGLTLDDGEVARSACVGFGLERIALALVHTHGTDHSSWPGEVTAGLGLWAALPELDAASYEPSELHSGERCWTETNCYVDVWIELLHALGLDAGPIGVCALSADFEGDQWLFLKIPPEDLRALYGIDVHEMNVWRPVVEHVEEQLALGRLLTVEADSHYLPDTAGVAYREHHVKSTICPARLDREGRRLGYFHNAGYFELSGEDFDALFLDPAGLPPYVEIIRLEGLFRDGERTAVAARSLLHDHLSRRPADNPVARLGERIAADLPSLAARGLDYFHDYAFGTARQCGASAEMAATFVAWLGRESGEDLGKIEGALLEVATGAKALEMKLARAAHGREVEIDDILATMAERWAGAIDALVARDG